ncbi:NAD(P)-dependent alcohol dehydrogenase [Idiomarina tyrosinivorans]|uniref:NAD(P)-dependent alcohol dehydrogenase n=1 Tax=Idiomarina tyrosinivorans TaxID=1445662 RepID=A0A432ZSH2_9GAMM|nr:NAD(P)-dependent alcohol dehydrogenase [Idiomarina tyrosinivorans]RUO80823.1 NAD(P)-dependent alcohol dehydrogenase [Idiomarina tyrosinivorans]
MKAVVVKQPGGLENLQVIDQDKPQQPGRGEIQVDIKASSLNFHDLSVALGRIKADDGRVLLSDGAGIVTAVGEGVNEFKQGDAVVSTFFPQWLSGDPIPAVANFEQTPGDGIDGMAAQTVVCQAEAFTHAPKGWSHEEAATITTAGLTAWRALVVDGNLKAGDTVVALGTGGVSIAALQIAKAMGARVIITSSSDEKLARAQELGADATINYKKAPEWGEQVQKLTDGKGAEHIIEVGGPDTLNQSITAAAVGGHIALIGVLTGIKGDVATAALMAKHIRLQGLIVGNRQQQQDYIRALEQTDIRPVIDKTYAFEKLAEAFDYQQNGKHFGKVCVRW